MVTKMIRNKLFYYINNINNSTLLPKYKEELFRIVARHAQKQVQILITGATGCGKSSTINALTKRSAAKVGMGADPQTMEISHYQIGSFNLWDTPGLGDGVEEDAQHIKKIRRYLNKTKGIEQLPFINLILVIVDGSSRDLGTTYDLINQLKKDKPKNVKIVVALNQADIAMKGKHWDDANNCPDETLMAFLQEKAKSVEARIYEATKIQSEVFFYSASVKNSRALSEENQVKTYNIHQFLHHLIKLSKANYMNADIYGDWRAYLTRLLDNNDLNSDQKQEIFRILNQFYRKS